MCLVVLAFGKHADYPLIVAGNRDEFHARPAADADWWSDRDGILGGRDLQAGGTWLALHRDGRFATVTNYHDAEPRAPGLLSRGFLVTGFLESDLPPPDYLATIDASAYAGFNLLVCDGASLGYLSNRGAGPVELGHGIYGLVNATIDTPWSKVLRSKDRLAALLDADSLDDDDLFGLLGDRERGPADEARVDRLPFETAHAITAPFIVRPDYGTRCSTVVRAAASGDWEFSERRFDNMGRTTGESRFTVAGPESRA
jgi:uncharacterized protein with NRDE domain